MAFQNTAGDPEYIELVHSGEDYFLRLKNLIENAQRRNSFTNLHF